MRIKAWIFAALLLFCGVAHAADYILPPFPNVAPASPQNGQVWEDSTGQPYVQIQGQPYKFLTQAIVPYATYYVSPTGSDSNSGTSTATAWQTIAHANLGASYGVGGLQAGQSLAFQGGQTFTGCLVLGTATNIANSSATNPIIVTSYGTGNAVINPNCPGANTNSNQFGPKTAAVTIDGSGAALTGLVFQNISVINTTTATNSAAIQYGILIQSSGGNTTSNVTIQNTTVEGFTVTSTNDAASEIALLGYATNAACGPLNNIKVLTNTLSGRLGATSLDDNGVTGYGCGVNITNVTYAGNTIFNIGGRAGLPSGSSVANGIVINSVNGAVAEYNLAYALGANDTSCGGPGGIWAYNANNAVIQYNEVYGMVPTTYTSGCDWAAYDLDNGVTNSVVQYNYAHGNWGPGIETTANTTSAVSAWGPNTIRYNVLQNNELGQTSSGGGEINIGGVLPSSGIGVINVYNNTVYNHNSTALFPVCIAFAWKPSGGAFANNVCDFGINGYGGTAFYDFGGNAVTGPTFVNNDYFSSGGFWSAFSWSTGNLASLSAWQAVATGADAGAIVTAPGYAGTPPVAGNCVWTPSVSGPLGPQPCPAAYKLAHTSPNLGIGTDLTVPPYYLAVGTNDYWGVAIPNAIGTHYNLGADGKAE